MNQQQSSLAGKVAVITGGYGTLCQALAKALADQGVKIAILGRNLEKAQNFASELNKLGAKAIGIKADVLNKEELEQANFEIKEKLGPCDFLINGAGGNHPNGTTTKPIMEEGDLENKSLKTFFDLDLEGFKYVFDLNMLGTLLPTQVFSKEMIGRAECTIINISSVAAIKPLSKVLSYGSAKAAISNFTEWLAVHFSQMGIRVNAIAPGFFLANQNRTLLTNPDGSLTPRGQQIIQNTPLGRFGKPEDLNSTLLWLLDPKSAFVTGIIVPVDGGFTAYSGV
ncbi:dehydrogenase of unknown specificity, short-chain alcohol dehydrogenase like protein [Belliella baltica DSM 15883]|uniref:Short-chain alcohol dehydrogenase like protein n=1 Tax=Belliella baltica (strain DSM 15883 / CIP 108006 / LMG 21964 / BA134) TaxID=866536 RepID=I3Z695_BELBD|nr:SDR family oxidoreductase [Belliella baltica]AFL84763.1 dehydrogenase of unknown specificity, short-chain alcohol dehydrogenase like protein [Belliella baltica DSM 15883]